MLDKTALKESLAESSEMIRKAKLLVNRMEECYEVHAKHVRLHEEVESAMADLAAPQLPPLPDITRATLEDDKCLPMRKQA
jgi:hypothetical protein